MLLISSKKPSSTTCASEKRNTVFLFSMPSFKYSVFRSSRRFDSLYPLLSVISNIWEKKIPLLDAGDFFANISSHEMFDNIEIRVKKHFNNHYEGVV